MSGSTVLRLQLPPLHALSADAVVAWALVDSQGVQQHGYDSVNALGHRFARVQVCACLDVQDVITLELQLPRLSGRRLQTALQGELEALLLDDMVDVAIAHGPQSTQGHLPVAWLACEQLRRITTLLETCGLRLLGVYPAPLMLPVQAGRATAQICGDYLLVRQGIDRSWMQWHAGLAVDTWRGQLNARLQADAVSAVDWIANVQPAAAAEIGTDALLDAHPLSGPLPAWGWQARTGSRRFPAAAAVMIVAAVVLAAVGLQVQALQLRDEGEQLQQAMQQQLAEAFPDLGEVIDPVLQARRALVASAPPPLPMPEVQQLADTVAQAVPELSGLTTQMRYRPGVLQLQLDPAAANLHGDPVRQENWQAALSAHGLALATQGRGRFEIHRLGAK